MLAQSRETRWARLETLQALLFPKGPIAVVTTIEALRKTLLNPERLKANFRALAVGQTADTMELAAWLTERGYERVERVEEKGQIALRAVSYTHLSRSLGTAIWRPLKAGSGLFPRRHSLSRGINR